MFGNIEKGLQMGFTEINLSKTEMGLSPSMSASAPSRAVAGWRFRVWKGGGPWREEVLGHPNIRASEEGGEAVGPKRWEQLPHFQADFLFMEV